MSYIRFLVTLACWLASIMLKGSTAFEMRMIAPTTAHRIMSNRIVMNRSVGKNVRTPDTQLQCSSCGAWMHKTESMFRNCHTTIPTDKEITFDESLYLTETVGEESSVSIVDFLGTGEIKFRASEVPDLVNAKGYWACDSVGNIVRMVINRTFSDGKMVKSHYLGSTENVLNDESHYVGGEVCVENDRCDVNDELPRKKFELTLAGPMIIRIKEKRK